MRTIKFRIWNKFLEKMSEPKKLCIDAELNAFYIDKPPHHDFELMQFTGLHDKNGKEIYEGDVLQTRSGVGHMVFDNCGYAIKSPGSEAVDYEFSAFYLECEIIGNIYENPELIS